MSKKAQMLGHIIVFVIGLAVISMVMIFGYVVLSNIQEQRCEVEISRFGTDLYKLLENNRDWGVIRVEDLPAPCDVKKVCFVKRSVIDAAMQSTTDLTQLQGISDSDVEAVILGSINAKIPANVFTVSESGLTTVLDRFSSVTAPIELVDKDALCIESTGGVFSIKMEGTGQLVKVSQE